MPKLVKSAALFSGALAVIFAALFYFLREDIYLTLAVTAGTVGYHFGMRLLVGLLYAAAMKNRADYTKKWYRVRPWEARLYQFLRVKTWKKRAPTYQPEAFSTKDHSWDEIAQAMCQSELVHETAMVLSFLPVIASGWLGAFPVFLLTSAGGALLDLLFAVIQRYNRPRVIRLAARGR